MPLRASSDRLGRTPNLSPLAVCFLATGLRGINAARHVLGLCEFNEGPCAEGLKALRSYRKEWDEEKGIWCDKPRHDWASDGTDAFRTIASRYRDWEPPPPKPPEPDEYELSVNPNGTVSYSPGSSIFDWAERRRKKRERGREHLSQWLTHRLGRI